jgi:hypothetical protein
MLDEPAQRLAYTGVRQVIGKLAERNEPQIFYTYVARDCHLTAQANDDESTGEEGAPVLHAPRLGNEGQLA